MCGRGGMTVSEWRRIKDVGLVRLYMEGLFERDRSLLEVGRLLIRQVASFGISDPLPSHYPFSLPWDNEDYELTADERTDEEKANDMEKAKEEFERRFGSRPWELTTTNNNIDGK